jgi:hypothetical protein
MLYMKTYTSFCAHLDSNSLNIYRSEKCLKHLKLNTESKC